MRIDPLKCCFLRELERRQYIVNLFFFPPLGEGSKHFLDVLDHEFAGFTKSEQVLFGEANCCKVENVVSFNPVSQLGEAQVVVFFRLK